MTNRIFIRKLLTAECFFLRFANNLDKAFPNGWMHNYPTPNCRCAVVSTNGWANALKETCIEMGLQDCWEHWDLLDWDESDELDRIIETLLTATIFDEFGYRIGEAPLRLGANVKAVALLKDVSIAEIAKALDCTEEETTKWLNGEIYASFQQLSDIAEVLDVPLSVLLEGVNDKEE